jgi:hypothetical protein
MKDLANRKPLQVLIDRNLHARVKMYAYMQGETIVTVINRVLEKELSQNAQSEQHGKNSVKT